MWSSLTFECRRVSRTRVSRPPWRRGARNPTSRCWLSQYGEERYGRELLESGAEGTGYLLKDRVADVGEFVSALEEVGSGGTVLDPEVVGQLLARRRRDDDLSSLTPREREVLALVAEGRTNHAIASTLFVTEGAVEKHVKSIFGKLGLAQSEADHRRVLAVLAYLRS